MFYLVLELPFKIVLAYKRAFLSSQVLDAFRADNPLYAAFEALPAWQVEKMRRVIWIPLK